MTAVLTIQERFAMNMPNVTIGSMHIIKRMAD